MRLKFDRHDDSSFRCCLCCHVRTGTIFLGLWHLVANLMVVTFLMYATIHPDILLKQELHKTCSSQETPSIELIQIDNGSGIRIAETQPYSAPADFEAPYLRKMTKEDLCVGFAITLCTLTVTLFLLYGTVMERPGYLLPFFCLQVFDFCLTCLTVVGYFSYAPNFKVWLKQQGLDCVPGLKGVSDIEGDWLMLLCLLFVILFISLKAYLLGIVWSCYKYLQMRVMNRNCVREYTVDPDSEMLLPPKYEEAIKVSNEQPPPPPYNEAV